MQRVIYWLSLENLTKIKGIVLLLFPIAFYFIPIKWLNESHTICIYKNITGNDCYGCGITRAILSVLHLQFANAFHYNKLVIIVFPLLFYIYLKSIYKIFSYKQ